MLDYKILQAKPFIDLPYDFEGTKTTRCKDLLSNVLRFDKISIENCRFVTVTKDYIARPDLISLAVYGTDKYADILCKLNNVSNPFELNEGMIIFVPDIANLNNIVATGKKSSTIDENDYISKTALKTNQKAKNESRSPAQQTIGESTFIIDRTNNIVFY